ncbi:MAG: Heimdall-CTERM domain-containing surface protein [Candidatus Kariarchaeaceae archaeon]
MINWKPKLNRKCFSRSVIDDLRKVDSSFLPGFEIWLALLSLSLFTAVTSRRKLKY